MANEMCVARYEEILNLEEAKLHDLEVKLAAQNGRVEGMRSLIQMMQGAPFTLPSPVPQAAPRQVEPVKSQPLHGFTHKPAKPPTHKRVTTAVDEIGTTANVASQKDIPRPGTPEWDDFSHARRVILAKHILEHGPTVARKLGELIGLGEMGVVRSCLEKHPWFEKAGHGEGWRITDVCKREVYGVGNPVAPAQSDPK